MGKDGTSADSSHFPSICIYMARKTYGEFLFGRILAPAGMLRDDLGAENKVEKGPQKMSMWDSKPASSKYKPLSESGCSLHPPALYHTPSTMGICTKPLPCHRTLYKYQALNTLPLSVFETRSDRSHCPSESSTFCFGCVEHIIRVAIFPSSNSSPFLHVLYACCEASSK